ncbi:hypothetical protein Purlil1_13532 [Purpureocillium lilacinum]|uniref:Uncharacterized protein n=1 Tax=Purpureocillium lilacinum TaxID=33203 RepID=A0ABR0BDT1_PURLI|nr:hypothetical protein Purlil1_13532 [Purpureocillium lilacinum]
MSMQELGCQKRVQMEVATSLIASPPKAVKPSSRLRDTGFPEPLSNDRNTTLPHPEADLSPSPNASISQDDVADGDLAPHKWTFLSRRRRLFHHGIVDRQTNAAFNGPLAPSSPDADARSEEGLTLVKASASSLRPPKNGDVS